MARSLFRPSTPPLVKVGSRARVLGRPDWRSVLAPARPSGVPLAYDECDYDDLVVHRHWRSYDPAKQNEVRYFMYEFSQTRPGDALAWHGYKAVRLIRLTRVPRYLRFTEAQSGNDLVFQQMTDVLVALREQQCNFLQVIAKSPELPLVFAYGVQAVGSTIEEAQALADESYAVLDFQLRGTYQQLRYQPLEVAQGELLSRYQSEWGHLAMARGRPLPVGSTLSTGAVLSDSRTDVESTNNQLESFIRGMTDKSFMLTLVTTPISPLEMNVALRNMAHRVSEARSDQEGSRGVNAGVALPLSFGTNAAQTHGDNHSTGLTHTDGTSDSLAHTAGTSTSTSVAEGTNASHTHTGGSNEGTSTSEGTNQATTNTTGAFQSHTDGTNSSTTTGTSTSDTTGTSLTDTSGTSLTNTTGTNHTDTTGTNASTTDGTSTSSSAGTSSTSSASSTSGTSLVGTSSTSSGSSVHGGVPGIGGSTTSGSGNSLASGQSNSSTTGESNSSSASNTNGASQSETNGTSNSVAEGTSTSVADGTSTSVASGTSSSVTDGTSSSTTTGTSSSDTTGTSTSTGVTDGTSSATGTSAGTSVSEAGTRGTSLTDTNGSGTNASVTSTSGTAASNATADTYMTSLSSSAGQVASFGASPYMGVSVSRRTFDVAKRIIGDLLEAQMNRYNEGVKSGAFFYQMFLLTPDRETLVGASGLLKSAFWGGGQAQAQLPQPFSVTDVFGTSEDEHVATLARLKTHAQVFTQYTKREYRAELIEPYFYSSYLTPSEAAAFSHPPTSESVGLLAVHDSMPVLAMPANRAHRDVHLGHIVNGEQARVTDQRYGFDVEEVTHLLVTGMTGFGKTTTLMRILVELCNLEREIVLPPSVEYPVARTKKVRAGILGFDWMANMRNLASVVEPERFRFYSIHKPRLGAFRWNPLAIPGGDITPAEWLNTLSDNFMASMNLGEFGRSIIAEALGDLYAANRLEPFVLRPALVDDNGTVLRAAEILEPIDRATLPVGALRTTTDGREFANVHTLPDLSRLLSVAHLATIVAAHVEANATVEAARLRGTAMRDHLQSVWRRLMPYAPGGSFSMITCDPSLDEKVCLTVRDLVDPDRGLVTIVETEGLDMENRRFILGSVILAVYRLGLDGGEGTFNHHGQGPGTYIVLEEAHELFGEQESDVDKVSTGVRTSLYESLFRRCRALGLKMVTLVQNPASIPDAVTSNTSSVIVHTTQAEKDRDKVFSMLNWSATLTQQLREWRYLGEMPRGEAIVRLPANDTWLESAPVLIKVDSPDLVSVSDEMLLALSER